MDFIAGIIGFLGFEGLKYYRRSWGEEKSSIPSGKIKGYVLSLLMVGLFASFAAHAFADGNMGKALYIGFSIPTGIKFINEDNKNKTQAKRISVDDVNIQPLGVFGRLRGYLGFYFDN